MRCGAWIETASAQLSQNLRATLQYLTEPMQPTSSRASLFTNPLPKDENCPLWVGVQSHEFGLPLKILQRAAGVYDYHRIGAWSTR